MTIEYKEKYMIIKADEGMVLTEWTEDMDILDFSYGTMQYCPLTYDTSVIREITQEECDRLAKEQEDRIREIEEQENENI